MRPLLLSLQGITEPTARLRAPYRNVHLFNVLVLHSDLTYRMQHVPHTAFRSQEDL